VLGHGLTFDRKIWQPIIDRLGDLVTSLAIDLPLTARARASRSRCKTSLIRSTAWCKHPAWNVPIVVGHSTAAAAAGLYAATYPTRGIVIIDQATEARSLHRALQSP
jgi:pimeloyl-ACP methyl ester carboxylesterase